MFGRIALFLLTNIAVMVAFSIVLGILTYFGVLGPDTTYGDWIPLLILAFLFGFGGSFISLALSKTMALRSTGAQVITQPRSTSERWLVETVHAQARAAGIGNPDVAIYPSSDVNAFATGMRRDSALVAVSTGLLQGMRQDEVEAVLAHEVSHIANGDMITMSLIQGVLNTFVIFASRIVGRVVDQTVFRTRRGVGPGYYLVTLVAELAFGAMATIIVMWFSRRREFRADDGAAKLAGPQKMIAALQRLQQASEGAPLPEDMAAFGIRSGGGGLLSKLFRSHPPLELRINALKAEYRQQLLGGPQTWG
ncbi:MAG: protease HtpX [Myxococcota bacterium]